jgi:hypothetical protein
MCPPLKALVAMDGERDVVRVPLADLALDLTDATGRVHAAWWAQENTPHGQVWQMHDPVCRFYVPHGFHGCVDLDPNDPRTLPDGSRWVDAEALRRVVLHVAGQK